MAVVEVEGHVDVVIEGEGDSDVVGDNVTIEETERITVIVEIILNVLRAETVDVTVVDRDTVPLVELVMRLL